MATPMKLVLATNNEGKMREIAVALADLGIQLLTRRDFKTFPDPDETGMTLEENARLKALAVFRQTGLPSLADDTGLEVDLLGGAPGIYSARFAGPKSTYEENYQKLLTLLDGAPIEKRVARFRTVIALAWDENEIDLVDGMVEGRISERAVPGHGFGYDPVFYYPPLAKHFSEMNIVEKNALSHRGRALDQAKRVILRRISA